MAEQVYYINEKGEKVYPLKKGPINEYGYATFVPIYTSDLGEDFTWNPQQTKNTVEIIEDIKVFSGEWNQDESNELQLPIDEIYPVSEAGAEEQAKGDMTGLEEYENSSTQEESTGDTEEGQSELEAKQLELIENQLKEYEEGGLKAVQLDNENYQKSIDNAEDEQGFDRKAREIQAHEQLHSTVSSDFTDSYGHITKVYRGHYANLDKNLRDKEEFLRLSTVNKAKKKASEGILGFDLTNFKYENKKVDYSAFSTNSLKDELTEEQLEILDLIGELKVGDDSATES